MDMLPDTIWLLEAERCIDSESFCNSLKKTNIGQRTQLWKIHSLLAWQREAWFDRANRDHQAWRGHKLVCYQLVSLNKQWRVLSPGNFHQT